jgi:tetratricopeptide (TPR) repeat protein
MSIQKLVATLVSGSAILVYVNGARSWAAETDAGSAEFKQAIEQGESFARHGDWAGASDFFFKASSLEPSRELGFYDLGIAYMHLSQLEKAKIAEERAVSLNPKFTNAQIQLATVLARLGENENAIEHLRQALALEPNNETAKHNLETLSKVTNWKQPAVKNNVATITVKAVANSTAKNPLAQANKEKEKEKQSAKAIAARPISVPFGLGAGEFPTDYVQPTSPVVVKKAPPVPIVRDAKSDIQNALDAFRSGKIDLAKKLIDDALKVDPNNEQAYASYGAVIGSRGEVQSEIDWEKRALAFNKTDAIAHMNLAWALARSGKWQEALPEYDQAVGFEPNLVEAKVGLGLAEMYTDRLALASATLSEAAEKYPKEAMPHVALSLLLAKQGEYGDAQAELQKAIDVQPENADALERVGAQELANENWQKAAEIYSKVLKVYPQDSQGWLGLALALERTDLKQKALNSFRKAAALSPKNSLIHMALALAYESRGRVAEAELELEEALRLNPEYRLAATQVKEQQAQK